MLSETSYQAGALETLRRQLATAEEGLERAQSFVFDLRCLTVREEGRGLWMRKEDGSGLREAIWGEEEGLGAWVMLRPGDVPEPSISPLSRELHSELGLATLSPSIIGSQSSSSARFPPVLFYHVVEHTTPSTNSSLCLVLSSLRAIASPRLYETMIVTSATQMRPFLPNPLTPLAPLNRSLTLDKVCSFDMTLFNDIEAHSIELETYPPLILPNLRHLCIRSVESAAWARSSGSSLNLSLASTFLSNLDPYSLSISRESQDTLQWKSWLEVRHSVCHRSTSSWTCLNKMSLVDFVDLEIWGQDDSDDFGG